MTYGFIIRDEFGAEVISNNSLGILFLDNFVLGAGSSFSKTYTGMASSEVRVVTTPIGAKFTGGTVTVTNSGDDKVLTITSIVNQSRFYITRE